LQGVPTECFFCESALPQGMQKYDPFLSFMRGWPATSAPQMQQSF
jgi:hypothetical protein